MIPSYPNIYYVLMVLQYCDNMKTFIVSVNVEQNEMIVKEVLKDKKISGHNVVMDILLNIMTTAQRRNISKGLSIVISGHQAERLQVEWL